MRILTNAPPPFTVEPPNGMHPPGGFYRVVNDVAHIGYMPLTNATPILDTNGPTLTPYHTAWQFTLTTGTNLAALAPIYVVTGMQSTNGTLAWVNDTNGQPVACSYATNDVFGRSTNYLPADVGTGVEPSRFYRVQ